MSMFGSMENLHTSQETQPVEQAMPMEQPPALERRDAAERTGDMPPAFGRREEQAGDAPPKVERDEGGESVLGESVEHRSARHQLERDIKNGNSIAAKHTAEKLSKIEAREALK